MKTYEIEQTATAVILWTGEAESKEAALDAYARDAGYERGRANIQKGCWMKGPPEEAAKALEIAVRAVAATRRWEGVAIIIRRAE